MNPSRRRPLSDPQIASETRMKVQPRAGGSFPARYARVRQILLGYLSPILVDSVLEKAMHARHMTPATLGEATLADVTSDIMVGLRLFVHADRLPQLMLELAEVLDLEHT